MTYSLLVLLHDIVELLASVDYFILYAVHATHLIHVVNQAQAFRASSGVGVHIPCGLKPSFVEGSTLLTLPSVRLLVESLQALIASIFCALLSSYGIEHQRLGVVLNSRVKTSLLGLVVLNKYAV